MGVQGSSVVVLGASGIVGGAILRSFLETDTFYCVAPARSASSRQWVLAEAAGGGDELPTSAAARLDIPIIDYSTSQGAQQLAAYLREQHGCVRHVVVAAGGMVPLGELTQLRLEDCSRVLHERVLSQVLLAQVLTPLLEESALSTYLIVTGRLGRYY